MNLGFAGNRQVAIGVGGLLLGAILTVGLIFLDIPKFSILLVLLNIGLLLLVIMKQYLFDSRFLMVSIYVLLGLTFLNNAFSRLT